MLERQRERIAKRRPKGNRSVAQGRRWAMAKAGEVEARLAKGVNPAEVARKLGIGRSSVYRAR